MASSNWSRVRRLVEEALEIPPGERARWLDSACNGDVDVRAEVEGLLAAEPDVGRIAAAPLAGWITELPAQLSAPVETGARIGAYEIVREIATGGMGTVYEARQRSPQRTVALKVMRESLTTAAERSRFRFEAEVLARLQHPNIAQIYESGVQVEGERGRRRETPYFAMELVADARTVIEYAEQHDLALRECVRLFLQVCAAVHHGHQRAVIHRDVKPSNLLVTATGEVKVIDFGVARAIVREGAARTLQTQSGQLIGTLGYMSPEQFGADPDATDVRSDVYALGTVLYELVVGRLPFAIEGKALHEIAQIVVLAAPRRPRESAPDLPAEIEWILLKALEKEPSRRYASASELALDLGRFLADEPVLAGAPSTLRRFRLAIRRNRAVSATAAVALIAIVASSAFYLRSIAASRATETQRLYVAMIAAADAALRVDDVASARGFLTRAPEALRNWEWRHLTARQDDSTGTWPGAGSAVAFRPGLGTLTATTANTVREWHAGLDREPRTLLELGTDWTTSRFAWSRDGAMLAIASDQGQVRIYSLAGEVRLQASADCVEKVHSICFSRQDDRIAVAGADAKIRVLDARTADELACLEGHRAEVGHVLFDPTGELVYSSGDTTVRAWDWRAGTSVVLTAFRAMASGLALSEDGRILAAGNREGSLHVLDPADGREIQRFVGLGPGPGSLTLQPGSSLALCGLEGGAVDILDVAQGTRVRTLVGHKTFVTDVVVSGETVATTGFDGEIKLWNLRRPAPTTTTRAHWGDTTSVSFDPRGTWFATGGVRDQLVCLWNLRTGRLLRVLTEHAAGIEGMSFSADGAWLATADGDGDVRVWQTDGFRRTWLLPASNDRQGRGRGVKFQGTRLLVFSRDGRLERWSLGQESPDDLVDTGSGIFTIVVDAESGGVVIGGQDGTIRRLDARTLGASWSVKAHAGSPGGLDITADGETVASISHSDGLVLQDARTGRVLRRLVIGGDDGKSASGSLSFSPDGSRLAVGSQVRLLRLFDVETLEPILSFRSDDWINGWFSPGGDALVGMTAQGTLHIWRTGLSRTDEGALDPEPGLLERADAEYAGLRAREPELEDALSEIESDSTRDPALEEALLERAHRERASKEEICRRALQVLVERTAPATTRGQAIGRARAVRRIETTYPEANLAQALARLRDEAIDSTERYEFALNGLERAENAALEPCDRVAAAARAAQAIALAHLGREDEARARLEEARRCPHFEPAWSALLVEADELLAALPAK